MAQLAEHVIGNDEVPGPNPGSSSKKPIREDGHFVIKQEIGRADMTGEKIFAQFSVLIVTAFDGLWQ